jgi:4-hydroxy-2-oxoheptanedioate aldolase
MRKNPVKQKLLEGKPSIGSWMNFNSPIVAERMAHVGFDWLVVDCEHSPIDMETLQNCFVAISTTDTVPMARIAWNDPVIIKRTLDMGAYGIVVPMVNSAEEAELAVASCKYPPEGRRSSGFGRAELYAGRDYKAHANEEIVVVIQIEHIDAVNNIEEIFSVKGIDAYFIGPGDLALSMGVPVVFGDNPDPGFQEAVGKIVEAGKKFGIPSGFHVASADGVNEKISQGYKFIALGTDGFFLSKTAGMELGKVKL